MLLGHICQKVKVCGHKTDEGCNAVQPEKYKLVGLEGISTKIGDEESILDIEYVKTLLEKITSSSTVQSCAI